MICIVLRGSWCGIIVLNAHARMEDECCLLTACFLYMCATIDPLVEGVQEEGAKEDSGPEQEKVLEVFG